MLLITTSKHTRPVYVRTEEVTAVIGPVHETQPVSPGKNKEHWAVEICMRDQKVHKINYDNEQEARDAVRLLTRD